MYICTTPNYSKTQQIVVSTIFGYLLLCAFIAFLQTIITNPGTTKKMLEYSDEVYIRNFEQYNDYKQIQRSKPQYCPICNIEKAERMHHDNFKNTCVARFDHRCSWTYCAIGLFNYPYFYKFCLYTSLFALFGLINSIVAISINLYLPNYEKEQQIIAFFVLLIFQIFSLFSVAIFIAHSRLTGKNITTIENLQQYKSGIELKSYSKGSAKLNFQQVLGKYYLLNLLLPFSIMKPIKDDNIMLISRVTFQQ